MNFIQYIKISLAITLLATCFASKATAQSKIVKVSEHDGISVYDCEDCEKNNSAKTSTNAFKSGKHKFVKISERDSISVYECEHDIPKPNKVAFKTNLLYDAVLVPNIGIEVNLGKRWTVGLDWLYTWFKNDSRHRYWQAYGGYLGVRKYLGSNKPADNSPRSSLPFPTGHHVGVYMSAITYDVEWGGKGYQASKFGFGGGIEYGYSKRIGKRLDLDFSIGIGYQGGEYKEYEPADDDTGHYIWLQTKKRQWFGPTKAEVSLKWILGPAREKKGGKR